jgi:hypothetical protein
MEGNSKMATIAERLNWFWVVHTKKKKMVVVKSRTMFIVQ